MESFTKNPGHIMPIGRAFKTASQKTLQGSKRDRLLYTQIHY